tara:strand:+ start:971 stop:1249 length:279 start_codon:yes stop_codon:yes gene_type:complete
MKNNFNYSLKERLQCRQEWLHHCSEYLLHKDITDRTEREFYRKQPCLSFILKIYFMPLNLIKYFSRIRQIHYYNKIQKEVEILKLEMEENEK